MATRTTKAALLASTATTAPVVTGAGVQVPVMLGGRSYTLAAPTRAQVGAFLDSQAMADTPTDAELTQVIRDALASVGQGADALDAYKAAEDAWVSFSSVHIIRGPDATETIQEQAVELHRAMLAARRKRDVEIAKVVRHPEVKRIQAEQQRAQRMERCSLLALLLRGWESQGLPAFPAEVDAAAIEGALPVGDLWVLGQRAQELMQPTAEVGKGSAPA
jgi:hypothetical protein